MKILRLCEAPRPLSGVKGGAKIIENGKLKMIFQPKTDVGYEHDHKRFKTGMKKYFRVPVGTSPPRGAAADH